MKVEDWEIRIGEFDDFKKAVLNQVGKPADGKVLFLKPKQFSELFTERRLELIRAIRRHPEAGVVELARVLGRHQEAVSRDLAVLRGPGLVTEGTPLKTSKKKPVEFSVKIPLPA
ncbi:MAG: hypothetical protein V1834_01055 [Candidatus Micrarchaeota archaeon]